MIGGTYTSAASTFSGTLTLDTLRKAAALLDANEEFNRGQAMANLAGGLFNPFGAVRLVESPLAARKVNVRQHKRRRNQTEAYHRRVQKKWAKRFGQWEEACAYQVDGGQFGLGSFLVVPLGIAAKLRAEAASSN